MKDLVINTLCLALDTRRMQTACGFAELECQNSQLININILILNKYLQMFQPYSSFIK